MRELLRAVLITVAMLATSCSGGSVVLLEEPAAGLLEALGSDAAAGDGLIARLGSEDAAADALIIAMERGYSGAQILDGVEVASLRADGTIVGQNPAGRPLGLVLYDVEGEGEGATGPDAVLHHDGEVTLASFFQSELTPIELLRQGRGFSGLDGAGTMTLFVLASLAQGFTSADVIELLILGFDEVRTLPGRKGHVCLRVVDEYYCPNGERVPVATDTNEDAEGDTEITNTSDDSPAEIPDSSDDRGDIDAFCAGWRLYTDTMLELGDRYERTWDTEDGGVDGEAVLAEGRLVLDAQIDALARQSLPREVRADIEFIAANDVQWATSTDAAEAVIRSAEQASESLVRVETVAVVECGFVTWISEEAASNS